MTRPLVRTAAAAVLLLALAAPAAAQSATLLRLRNPASQDRLVVDSAGALLLPGPYNSGAVQNPGAGPVMMWYPRKAAFRAGYVDGTLWNDASVGPFSVAMGANTTASNFYSFAVGYSTVASGNNSTAMGNGSIASGTLSTAIGYHATANFHYATAIGFETTASGISSIAIGKNTTASGNYSTAMGGYASTNGQEGSFVYGDLSTSTLLTANAPNQFSVRAAGGVRFFTNSGMSLGAQLGANQTAWSTLSDRNRKTEFLAVDGEDVLARIRLLPVSTWIYTDQPDASVRHIGPMAQDWHAAFGLSSDSLTINSADFDGVNLAAAQALEARTRAQAEQIRALQAENAALREEAAATRARLARIEALLEARP